MKGQGHRPETRTIFPLQWRIVLLYPFLHMEP